MEEEWVTFRGLQRWRDTDGVRRGFLSMDLTATGWEGHEFAWIKGIDFVRGIVLLFFYYFVEGGWSFNAASLWYFSSGNRKCEWFVKFYSSLINYERICRTILILRYFSNGIGVALESWERTKKERNTRRTLLPIQFWRKHRIFNFLCNDHLPLNRLEPIYPFHWCSPISRWFWLIYNSSFDF